MEQRKEARKIQRQKMVENKLSLYNIYMSAGREFLHDILEVYTSPKILFEKVKKSSYYSSLNEDDRQTLEVVNEENSFSELEIDFAFELLKRFTSIRTPKCEWCEHCLKCDTDFSHEGENLEIFMNIWKNVVCHSNFISEEKFSEYSGVLWYIAENLCKTFACGKSLKDMLECDLFQKEKRPNSIHILSLGKELNIQIGENNKTFLKIEVFDHVGPTSKEVPEENDMSSEELVKMILHLHPTSSSGISIARIEERFLLSLCGSKLEELNEILKERFGVEIIVTRKGCVVMILRKIDNSQWFFETFSRLEMFLKDVFMFVTSVDVLSGLTCTLDITRTQEVEKSATNSDFSVELILKPAAIFKSMSGKKITDLVSTIIVNGNDKGDHDITDDIEITADVYYIKEKKNKAMNIGSCASNQQNAEYPGLNRDNSTSTQQNSHQLESNQQSQYSRFHQQTSSESNPHHIRCSKLSKQYYNHSKTSSESGKVQQCNAQIESNPTIAYLSHTIRKNILSAGSNRIEEKVAQIYQPNNSGLAQANDSELLQPNNPCTEYIHTNTESPRSYAPGLVKPNLNGPGHMQHNIHNPGLFQTNRISPEFCKSRSGAVGLVCSTKNDTESNVNYFYHDKKHTFGCTSREAISPLHDFGDSIQRKDVVVPEKKDSKSYEMYTVLRRALVLLVTLLLVVFVIWTAVISQTEKPEDNIKNRTMMQNYQRSLWEAGEKSEFQLIISAKFSERFKERLKRIRYINMSSKSLNAIDFSFLENFTDVEVLDISYNKMQYFTLNSSLSNLKVIEMQSNMLRSVVVLKRLPSLKAINLRCNRISYISTETFNNLPLLQFLDLSFNPITGRIKFDPSLFSFIPNLLQEKNEKIFSACELNVKTVPEGRRNIVEAYTEQNDSKVQVNMYNVFKNKKMDRIRKTNYSIFSRQSRQIVPIAYAIVVCIVLCVGLIFCAMTGVRLIHVKKRMTSKAQNSTCYFKIQNKDLKGIRTHV